MSTPKLWTVSVQALSDWWEDNCLRLAAALAFYTALSLAPLLLLVVGLLGMVLERQQVAGQLAMQLEGAHGPGPAGSSWRRFSRPPPRRAACWPPSSVS